MYFKILEFLKKSSSPNFVELLMPEYISEPNKHIEEYLDYYCNDRLNDYAVLIKGNWGAGKTWFIKEYEKKLKKDGFKRVIYISLNGVSKKDAIDDMIFCALHPVLSHRATKVLSKVATSLLKASTKIDMDGDSKKETSLSISLPTININEALKKGERLILIFDDLERCQMGIAETLGYINYFVEHTESKAIILSNEEKFSKCDIYKKEKEKLVGATFEFKGDIGSALNHFILELSSGYIKSKLSKDNNFESVVAIYNDSKFNNLRSLKQSLKDFERFYSKDFLRNDDELFIIILKVYLSVSLEYKNNGFEGKVLTFKKSVDENDGVIKDIFGLCEKYKLDNKNILLFSDSVWHSILADNFFEENIIKKQLSENYFKHKEDKPAWYKINNYNNLDNYKFKELLEVIQDNINNLACKELGEILHSVAAVLFFKNKGVIAEEKKDFISNSLKCVEKIYLDSGDKYFNRGQLNLDLKPLSWGGLYYLGNDSKEFEAYLVDFKGCLDSIEKNKYEERINNIYSKIIAKTPHFIEDLILWEENTKQDEIIAIEKTNVENIVRLIPLLERKQFDHLLDFFRKRRIYLHNTIGNSNELKDWMEKIIENLKKECESLDGIEKLNFFENYIHRIQKIHEYALKW